MKPMVINNVPIHEDESDNEHRIALCIGGEWASQKKWYEYEEVTSQLKKMINHLAPRSSYNLLSSSCRAEIINKGHYKIYIGFTIMLSGVHEYIVRRMGSILYVDVELESTFGKPHNNLLVSANIFNFQLHKTEFKDCVILNTDYSELPNTEFKNITELLTSLLHLRGFWYRGNSECGHLLVPRIARKEAKKAQEKLNSKYMQKTHYATDAGMSLETHLMKAFIKQASFLHPELQNSSTVQCSVLMQHHGMPTRLLDWTSSPWVALYFAVCDEKDDDKDGDLVILRPDKLNDYNEITPLPQNLKALFERRINSTVAFDPMHINLRMKAQEAKFTLHSTNEPLAEHDSYLRRIKIPKKTKPELRQILQEMGYTRSKLFPDLDNITLEIKEYYGFTDKE